MNMNNRPQRSELAALLAACDDSAGDHIIWVDQTGRVHVSLLPDDLTPVGFEAKQPTMKLRLETLGCGNGYVGPQAALDDTWVAQAFGWLVKHWPAAQNSSGVIYSDH